MHRITVDMMVWFRIVHWHYLASETLEVPGEARIPEEEEESLWDTTVGHEQQPSGLKNSGVHPQCIIFLRTTWCIICNSAAFMIRFHESYFARFFLNQICFLARPRRSTTIRVRAVCFLGVFSYVGHSQNVCVIGVTLKKVWNTTKIDGGGL